MKKILLLTTILVVSLFSATFNVSTTPELRTALSTAATNGEDDTIILADGTYYIDSYISLNNIDTTLTIKGESTTANVVLNGINNILIGMFKIYDNNSYIIFENITFEQLIKNEVFNISNSKLKFNNCDFINNDTYYGVFTINTSTLEINNSLFNNNTSKYGASSILAPDTNLIIRNTTFSNNTGNVSEGSLKQTGVIASSSADDSIKKYIINSKFYKNIVLGNNSDNSNDISASQLYVINSIFDGLNTNNFSSIKTSGGSNNLIINSYFQNYYSDIYDTTYTNKNYLINNIFLDDIYSENLVAYNNLLEGQIKQGAFSSLSESNNIYSSSITFDEEYKTTSYDTILSKGYDINTLPSNFLQDQILMDSLNYDYSGNQRILGNIDIGPFEYQIDDSPEISSFVVSGVNKIYNYIQINATITAKLNRTINELYFDYGDGEFVQVPEINLTYKFTTSGNYILRIKAVDSEGVETIQGLSLTIEDFTTTETISYITSNPSEFNLVSQTQSDTLVSLAQTAYYNTGIATGKQYVQDNLAEFNLVTTTTRDADVQAATTAGITTGQANVTSNPSNFGLVTLEDKNSAVTTATNTGIATGKQYVQDNLTEFNLVTTTTRDADVQSATTAGITTGQANVTSNPSNFGLVTLEDKNSAVTTATNTGIATGKQYVQDNLTEFNLVTTTTRDADVQAATTAGITTGQANVTSNPSNFGLVTLEDKNSAVTTALEQGKQLVISNPSNFGLELKKPLTKASIDALSSGWHNISNPSEITDLTIFDSASIVWIFNNSSNSWEAYSSNSTYKNKIQNSTDTTLATKVNSGVGIWILK
jgi:ribosomal protein S8E